MPEGTSWMVCRSSWQVESKTRTCPPVSEVTKRPGIVAQMPWIGSEGHQRSSAVISGHHGQSSAISGNQRTWIGSEGHQRSSAVVSGHHGQSEAISGNQRQSAHLDWISSFREGCHPLAQQGVIHRDSAANGHQHMIALVT